MLNREDWITIHDMREKGCYLRDIAARVGCSERTVRRALKRGGPPPRRRPGVRPSKLDPFKPLIDRLLSEDVWNAEVIYAEIRARGYSGGQAPLHEAGHPARNRGQCPDHLCAADPVVTVHVHVRIAVRVTVDQERR